MQRAEIFIRSISLRDTSRIKESDSIFIKETNQYETKT